MLVMHEDDSNTCLILSNLTCKSGCINKQFDFQVNDQLCNVMKVMMVQET